MTVPEAVEVADWMFGAAQVTVPREAEAAVTVKTPFRTADVAVAPVMTMVEPTGGAHV